ncbi:MAG: pentapeptide repeat-containing protein [Syntrophothermus sp.]
METKKKIGLPGLFRMTIIVPLSMPAFLWISTHRPAWEWSGPGKAALASLQTKTFWDWIDLLLLPIVLVAGAYVLTRSQRSLERQRADENASMEREIASDRQKEEALQAYFDRMSELLLKDKLSKFSPEEVRNVARIRTLSVLRGLDSHRKGLVLLFLKDSGLIDREAVIDLCGADLSETFVPFASLGKINLSEANLKGADLQGAGLAKSYLSGTNLKGANLVGANLAGADLFEADLSGADLSHAKLNGARLNGANLRGCRLNEANLSDADLSSVNLSVGGLIGANLRGAKLGGARLAGADLSEADLSQADLSGTQLSKSDLEKAKSLEGATLPDGTKHE